MKMQTERGKSVAATKFGQTGVRITLTDERSSMFAELSDVETAALIAALQQLQKRK